MLLLLCLRGFSSNFAHSSGLGKDLIWIIDNDILRLLSLFELTLGVAKLLDIAANIYCHILQIISHNILFVACRACAPSLHYHASIFLFIKIDFQTEIISFHIISFILVLRGLIRGLREDKVGRCNCSLRALIVCRTAATGRFFQLFIEIFDVRLRLMLELILNYLIFSGPLRTIVILIYHNDVTVGDICMILLVMGVAAVIDAVMVAGCLIGWT